MCIRDSPFLSRVLVAAGLCASNGEARRLVAQGGVQLDGARVSDAAATLERGGSWKERCSSGWAVSPGGKST